ncbi:MAG: response regulator [Elusimicrobia bacterium]|nr:response regulator [Elusimicrobiota bacterium]
MVKETAYIVDRDEKFVERLKNIIGNDYIISTFSEPGDAVDLILKKKPDIVITELLFPSLDGINFVASLKERCAESPIVVVTKLPVTGKFASIFEISDCWGKNLSDDELYERIKKASGWKRKKVSPPALPIITEGAIGTAVKNLLDEVYEEKKNLCLRYMGEKNYARAIEIAAFLRRVFPTDLRTQGLIREIILSPDVSATADNQTTFSMPAEEINAILRENRDAHSKNDLPKMLDCAKKLLLGEDVKNGVRILREIVVFSEENPFLAEQVVIKKEGAKLPLSEIICGVSLFLSFFLFPYEFAGIAIVSGIWSLAKKSKKVARFAIPMAVAVIGLNLAHFPMLSGMIEKWYAQRQAERAFNVSPKFFRPGSEMLLVRYRVKKYGPVKITVSSGRQHATIIDNPSHEAGTFTVQWNGKADDGSFIKNNFYIKMIAAGREYRGKIYVGK